MYISRVEGRGVVAFTMMVRGKDECTSKPLGGDDHDAEQTRVQATPNASVKMGASYLPFTSQDGSEGILVVLKESAVGRMSRMVSM